MKSLFFVLLVANLAAGAWLLLQSPVSVVREPGRMDLQLEQGRVRVISEAEATRLRQKAESDAAANEALSAAGGQPGPGAAATGASPSPAGAPAGAAPLDLPLASCVDIGPFGSESATRKVRARLAAAGITEHVSTSTSDKVTRIHITGVDAAAEAQLHLVLRDFPKQEMNHCSEAAPGR